MENFHGTLAGHNETDWELVFVEDLTGFSRTHVRITEEILRREDVREYLMRCLIMSSPMPVVKETTPRGPVAGSGPVPMLIHCPMCNMRHIDKGKFAATPHHTHACQGPTCGHVWRPAIVHTVGVQHLPGFKNDG